MSPNLILGTVSVVECREFYWVTRAAPWDTHGVVRPRRWVSSSTTYADVARLGLDPARLAAAGKQWSPSQPSLAKCVGEAVYEAERVRVSPSAPSRLHCLFVASDAMTAVTIAERCLPPPQFDSSGFSDPAVVPASTADGPWIPLDMELFDIPTDPLPTVPSVLGSELQRLAVLAKRYWSGETSNAPQVEVLTEKLWLWTRYLTPAPPPPFTEWMARHSKPGAPLP